jgi:hypothetical protein
VTVTPSGPGRVHIEAVQGAGEPNPADLWGQLVRLDFVPNTPGVIGSWQIENLGGALEGAGTACAQ